MHAQPLGLRSGQPAQLAHQPEQGRAADGETEHGAHHGVDAFQGLVGRGPHRCGDDDVDLPRRRLQHGVDELLLAGEPVQDGLLAHADDGGDVVEGDGIDAASAEQVERGGEDALAGGRHMLV